jgi:hypothetical protein
MITVSLYQLARLQEAQVCEFQRISREIHTKGKYRKRHYREALPAILSCHDNQSKQNLLTVASQLRIRAAVVTDSREQGRLIDNAEILESYAKMASNNPLIRCPQHSTLESPLRLGWGGMLIKGRCHVALNGADGRVRFRYFFFSNEWSDRSKRFAIHLVAEMICHTWPEISYDQIEGIDCRSRSIIRGAPLNLNERKRLNAISQILTGQQLPLP